MRLSLAVRADEQPPRGARIAPDHIADAVDHRIEPGLGEFVGEPLARGDILGRVGRPVHPGLVAPELGETLQVGDDRSPSVLGIGALPLSANLSAI